METLQWYFVPSTMMGRPRRFAELLLMLLLLAGALLNGNPFMSWVRSYPPALRAEGELPSVAWPDIKPADTVQLLHV